MPQPRDLRKTFTNLKGGGQAIAFHLEPGAVRIPERWAREAIASGRLVPRDAGLFDDPDNAQTWIHASVDDGAC
jgi:hypothetical protein